MWIVWVLVFISIIAICNSLMKNNNENTINVNNINDYTNSYRKNNYVLTVTELKFYRELIKVTEKLNLVIFPKIRMADILTITDKTITHSAFNKIKAKHIDFVLCDKSNCKVRAYVELDDYTHNKQYKNDSFKNKVLGKYLIRVKVYNTYNLEWLEQKIVEAIRE